VKMRKSFKVESKVDMGGYGAVVRDVNRKNKENGHARTVHVLCGCAVSIPVVIVCTSVKFSMVPFPTSMPRGKVEGHSIVRVACWPKL